MHLVRDRHDTPSLAEAFFCVVLIFVIQFFMQVALSANVPTTPTFRFFALSLFISQVVCIALPALLMTLIPHGAAAEDAALLARSPSVAACGVAVLLAVLLHPFGHAACRIGFESLYPVAGAMQDQLKLIARHARRGAVLRGCRSLLMAVLPAICEELAFRGFILSGLRHLGSKWWAIGLSAVFFGFAHGVVQQSLSAAALGLVIGYIAVQTGSLIPCILFHVTYNGLAFATSFWPNSSQQLAGAGRTYSTKRSPDQILFGWPVVVVCLAAAMLPLLWLRRLPYQATREEQISDARSRQAQQAAI